jgi:hypothetical protein
VSTCAKRLGAFNKENSALWQIWPRVLGHSFFSIFEPTRTTGCGRRGHTCEQEEERERPHMWKKTGHTTRTCDRSEQSHV